MGCGISSVNIDIKELEREGWTRRFTASGPRLEDAVEDYRDLGLEVLLIPILDLCAQEEPGSSSCTSCFEADDNPGSNKVLFTRRAKGPTEG